MSFPHQGPSCASFLVADFLSPFLLYSADPALVRASMVATRLKSLDEHMPIIQALEGTYVSPSAAVDVELPLDLVEATAAAAVRTDDIHSSALFYADPHLSPSSLR